MFLWHCVFILWLVCVSHSSPVQTDEGVITAAVRLLGMLKVAAGFVPLATGLYLNSLSHATMPLDMDQIPDSPAR